MAQEEQKAHIAMRLSLPPDVHEWLWAEKGRTGRPMHELAVESIKDSMRASPLDGGAAVARADKVRNIGSPPAQSRPVGKPLSDHVSPVPRKPKKKRGGRIR